MDRGLLFVLFTGAALVAARARQHWRDLRSGREKPPSSTISLSTEPDGNPDLALVLDVGDRVVFEGQEPPGMSWAYEVSAGSEHVSLAVSKEPTPTPGTRRARFTLKAKTAGSVEVVFALVDEQDVRSSAFFTIEVR